MELPNKTKSGFSEIFRKLDIFSLNIGLTHSGLRTYKSSTNGFFSVVTLLCILSYFVYLTSDIWNFKVSINNSLKKRDLVFDNSSIALDELNFDFAINIDYRGFNASRRYNLFRFVSVKVHQTMAEWQETDAGSQFMLDLRPFELEWCTEKALNGDTKYLEKMGIVGNYFCPVGNNFTIQGGMQSDEVKAVSIYIAECDQKLLEKFHPGEVCADLAEQQQVASELMTSVIFTNQYFSGENQLEPIQQDYKIVVLGVPIMQTFYSVLKLSVNQAILKDSWLFESYSAKNISYSTIRVDQQYGKTQIPYDPRTPYLSINVFLDENVDINERIAFNFVMALQSIGGFSSIVMIISKIFCNFVQQYRFDQEMVSLLYSKAKEDPVIESGQKNSAQISQSQDSRRKLARDNKPDLEMRQLRLTEHIRNVVGTQIQNKMPTIDICSYFCLGCCSSKQSRFFKKGKALLQHELSLKSFIQTRRLLQLYLDLTLSPSKKKILTALVRQSPISESCQLNHTIERELDSETPSLEDSIYNLNEQNGEQEANSFNQKLAAFMGIQTPKTFANVTGNASNQNRQKKRIHAKLLVEAKSRPTLSFKQTRNHTNKQVPDKNRNPQKKGKPKIKEEQKDESSVEDYSN